MGVIFLVCNIFAWLGVRVAWPSLAWANFFRRRALLDACPPFFCFGCSGVGTEETPNGRAARKMEGMQAT